jgi:hypothetical protein
MDKKEERSILVVVVVVAVVVKRRLWSFNYYEFRVFANLSSFELSSTFFLSQGSQTRVPRHSKNLSGWIQGWIVLS